MSALWSPRTVTELLRYRAEHDPDRIAYRFLDYGADGDPLVSEISYGDLERKARVAAAAIAAAGTPGDRAMVLCSPGLPYIVHFYASLYAGMIAVLAFPPGATGGFERLDAIARDCGAAIVLTDTADTARKDAEAAARNGSVLAAARWLSVEDTGRAAGGEDWTGPDATEETIAFLQYTSGSTAQPKGVMISHGNVLANGFAGRDSLGMGPDTPVVNWAPLYHNAGLGGGVTIPLCSMSPSVHMAPTAFVRSPQRWLEAISKYGGAVSPAPNFAYGLCAARVSEEAKQGLDLSTWKVAINGAEPVTVEVLDDFAAAFAACGFDKGSFVPVYGLAENTLLVSAKPVGSGVPAVRLVSRQGLEQRKIVPVADDGDGQPLVSCGIAGQGIGLRIVDPATGGETAPGILGEIWVGGSSVASGYFRAPEASADTFRCTGERPGQRYVRTGDLGAVIDGELYVTGRVDDLMIFSGRNIYPQDIEQTSGQSDPMLASGRCAAFAVDGQHGAELVVVQELPRRETTPQEQARFAAAIRRQVSAKHGLSVTALVLAPAGAVPTTASGKIQRKACRARFLAGQYPAPTGFGDAGSRTASERDADGGAAAASGSAAAEIEYRMRELIAQAAGCAIGAVSAGDPFAVYGLSSLQAVDLAGQLSDWLGRVVPATIAWNHPNIGSAARWLAGERAVPRQAIGASQIAASSAGWSPSDEPLAIVGMSCRYPGGVGSPEELWELVANGRDAVTGLPEERGWDLERLYDPDPDHPGTVYTRGGGFADGVGDFDAGFFGIGPREALAMDPQQRLVLEGAWEALEDAGIDPLSLRGSATGVFCGAIASDYGGAMTPELEGFRLTGTTASVISGRVAYCLGLEGPAVSVDTACSSSLVALHLASQALRSGECSLAIAGGVTVMAGPFLLVEFSRQRGLAPDGRCKSFAASADGTGFSDGMGLVVLERLSDARYYGHKILALVRGSAVNQDGASNGLTAPSGSSQVRVIRTALASAGLTSGEVDVVEGHGTGTKLGDPVEAQALLATYGQDRPRDRPLWLGSVKSNIGHSSAASGVAGVIKMVQAMAHGLLPATLHVDAPSPHVDWEAGAVKLLTGDEPWPDAGRPRRAGVSSFGVSGTNAHLILEQAPAEEQQQSGQSRPLPVVPVLVSARGEAGLRAQAGRLREHLLARPELGPADAGFSTAVTRAQLKERAAVVAADRDGLLAGLEALAAGEPAAGVFTAAAVPGRTAFLFPGQGTQRPGMGTGLAAAFPAFGHALDEVCGHLDPLLGRPLGELLAAPEGSPEAGLLDQTRFTQAALFAVEVALFKLAGSLGIRPDYLIGHSVGEIAAAHVAGVLSLEDACTLVAARGELMAGLAAGGAMAAVEAAEDEVAASLAGYAGRLAVAAVNGPQAVVVSGDQAALEEWLPRWEDRKTSWLRVSHAFHSPLMDPALAEFRRVAAGLTFREPRIPIVSNLTGVVVSTGELADPGYWVRHAREAVRFADGITALAGAGVTRFLELGPDTVLTSMARQVLDGQDGVLFAAALRARRPEAETFAGFLAQAHVMGVEVDWEAYYAGSGARRVPLPAYAFQRQRYWLASGGGGDPVKAGQVRLGHPVLAAAVPVGDRDEWVFTGRLSVEGQPWLADHMMLGSVLAPGALLAELALAAGQHAGAAGLEELVLEAPLLLPAVGAVQVQVTVGEGDSGGRRAVAVYSRVLPGRDPGAPEAVCHARGTLAGGAAPAGGAGLAGWAVQWPPPGAEAVPAGGLYERLAGAGYEYGPAFQGLRAAWRDGEVVYAEVALADEQAGAARGFGIHPALLDAALHAALLDKDEHSPVDLPFSWSEVWLERAGAVAARVRVSPAGGSAVRVDIAGADGGLIAGVGRLAVRPVDRARLEAAGRAEAGSLFTVDWHPVTAGTAESKGPVRIAVLGTDVRGLGAGSAADRFADLDALQRALADGSPVPDVVIAVVGGGGPADVPASASGEAGAVRAAAGDALGLVREWVACEALAAARLAVVVRGGVAVGGEAPDAAAAAAWGLVRSAQSEHPGRFVLVDAGGDAGAAGLDWGALASLDEPQLAVRAGTVLAPRLVRAESSAVPGGGVWRLGIEKRGSLEDLALVPGDGGRPLGAGEVRLGVRAAGLNFRDVLIALGLYPGEAPLGSEAAGVVLETGPGAGGLVPGDRVLGLVTDCFGPVAVADARLLARVPDGWSFAQAASVPVAFLTAWYGLFDLAGLRPGEKVLVHAAAGGVGMAAVQLARHAGAEVYATASPAKWQAVRDLGVPAGRIASSRDLGFRETFLEATGGHGVDVVLDALAGEFVDASLDLLPGGGRFIEMGKADVRDPQTVARARPGVAYRSYDLMEAGPERTGQILAELMALFARGMLALPPVRCWDVRRGAGAFRFLREGRNTGKVVLTVPAPFDPGGAVLVTGGTGGLGGLVARHLAKAHGVRYLVLASRRGPDAAGAGGLAAELEGLGCQVRVAACDVGDRVQLAGLLAGLDRPLTAVVHAAGIIDDGVVASLTGEQLERVLRPKADAALLLDELTAGLDLAGFVLFSSAAGLMGSPGQGNYAAANAVLDAIAARRRAAGQAGVSLAWGLWEQETGMTGALDQGALARLARAGIRPLPAAEGLELFDRGRQGETALAVPVSLDLPALGAQARAGTLPPLLSALVRAPARRAGASSGSLAKRLAAVPETEREHLVLNLVQARVAAVLGHASADAVDPGRAFKDLGFDSLAAVELRNQLTQAAGLELSATLVFDHPTPAAVARHLLTQASQTAQENRSPLEDELRKIEALLAEVANDEHQLAEYAPRLRSFSNRLWSILDGVKSYRGDAETEPDDDLDRVSDDEVFELIDKEIGAL